MAHPSDSSSQVLAEDAILRGLEGKLGVVLRRGVRLELSAGVQVKVDGQSVDPPILVEAFARQSKLLAGQKGKISRDILKLVTLRSTICQDARLILALSCTAADKSLNGWLRHACSVHDIEVVVVELTDGLVKTLKAAEKARRMVNAPVGYAPDPDEPLEVLWAYALTYDGYRIHGDDGAGDIANAAFEDYRRDGRLPSDPAIARCSLFFEQRRWRHFGEAPDREAEAYVRALIRRIAELQAS